MLILEHVAHTVFWPDSVWYFDGPRSFLHQEKETIQSSERL